MIELLNLENKKACREYEQFVSSHPNGNFMQSLGWLKVKSNWDHQVVLVRNGVGYLIATMLVLIKKVGFQTFLYAPHGPVCDYRNRQVLEELLEGIAFLKKKHRAYLFRMDPCILEGQEEEVSLLEELGFVHTYNPPELSTIQSRNNYILNLKGRSEEEIFGSFHSKWRYNIRLAERKGVECRVCGLEALDDFYKLMQFTGERDGFPIRGKSYFKRMLEGLGEHCRLYLCYYEGTPLSGAIAVQYAGKTHYVYGASSNEYRNLMPNYLMQWTMIRWAIKGGCTLYDFQGIPFYQDETHPNYGVYRFKQGFRGEVVTYAGEFDLCYSPMTEKAVASARVFCTRCRRLHENIAVGHI